MICQAINVSSSSLRTIIERRSNFTQHIFKSVGSACKNTCNKELNPKRAVSDCCDVMFRMTKEDYSRAIIINFYFHVCKSVKIKHAKYLRSKMLKNAMLAEIKKLQIISCAEDVEKGFDLTAKEARVLNSVICIEFSTF